MGSFLYPDFLNDKRQYNLVQASWNRLFIRLGEKYDFKYSSYLNPYDSSGRKEYDGNPIFNAFIPKIKKAVRIIQVSPGENVNDISAWIDEIEITKSSSPVKELVIDLALSKETKNVAIELIDSWVIGQINEHSLDLYLSKDQPETTPA
ncbi:MAG: hypothetical protein DWQ02_25760 [Bacteroidetes bacterium]|nr:MAG: hypothetical protein DWQ02_25760 [Bacteroidota bacterium]